MTANESDMCPGTELELHPLILQLLQALLIQTHILMLLEVVIFLMVLFQTRSVTNSSI